MPTTKIQIPTFNGGVSRRESSKRLPQEVQEADNVVLTVDHIPDAKNGIPYMGETSSYKVRSPSSGW